MRVVSNTSPISNLAIIDRLDLLPQRYGRIVIPPAVKHEVLNLSHCVGRRSIEYALQDGWIVEETLPEQTIFAELRDAQPPLQARPER